MGPIKTISSLSTEPIQIGVDAKVNGVPINPSTDTVQFAFTAGGNPGATDWHSGSWEAISSAGSTVYIADCQIGPNGGVVLAVGTWTVWIKVVDNPDIPVRQVGLLQIT